MKTLDFVALIAFALMFVGLVLLFLRYGPGGGGGNDTAYPSWQPSQGGGFIPGYTTANYRNGGTGAMQPQIWSN